MQLTSDMTGTSSVVEKLDQYGKLGLSETFHSDWIEL